MALCLNGKLFGCAARIVVGRTTLTSSARVASSVKTPIQKWGWDYLLRQRSLKRPLSPHLTVYTPKLPMITALGHRISGVAMATAVALAAPAMMVVPFDFTQMVEFASSFNVPWPITSAFKFVIALPIVFHTLNGVRFMGFDLAIGTDLVSVYRTGYFVLGGSVAVALVIALWPILFPKEQEKPTESAA